jgi:hypothetical protein
MKPQPYRKEKVPGRNDRCPCGSGKKAKRCCLSAIQVLAALPPHLRQQVVVAQILGHPVLSPPPQPPSLTTGDTIIVTTQPQETTCVDTTCVDTASVI